MTLSAGLPAGLPLGPPAGLLAGRTLAAGLEWTPKPINLDRALMGFQADIVRKIAGDRVPWRLAKAFAESEALAETAALQRRAAATAERWQSAREAMRESQAARLRKVAAESFAVAEAAQGSLDGLSTDREIRLWAGQRVAECVALAESITAADTDALTLLSDYAAGWLIDPPEPEGARHVEGCIARLQAPRWWRGQARKVWAQRRETRAIYRGAVSATAGLYVSEDMMQWVRKRRQSNREMLETLEAINDAGTLIALTDAIDASVSNPDIRCTEMMVRNAGMEFLAECRGDDALFLTWTAARKYHARQWRNKRTFPNPVYEGATPRQTQARIAELWDGAVRKLRSEGIRWYGSRFVQPHHDGTPHWHLLVYVAPADRERLIAVMREAALTDEPGEPGAQRRRFDVRLIDRAKGSAVGYVARYIARAVNGKGLKALKERDDGGRQREVSKADGVERVTAWASVWRIRLFQFIGTPPVTVWRELRRKRDGKAEGFALEVLREAADAGDYAEWLEMMGGVCTAKKLQTAHTLRESDGRLNCYGEAPANKVRGVQLSFEFSADTDPAVLDAVAVAVAAVPSRRSRRRAARRARREAIGRPDVAARLAARPAVLTRIHVWTVRRKGSALAAVASDSPWTRVNNCPAKQPAGPPDPSRIAA